MIRLSGDLDYDAVIKTYVEVKKLSKSSLFYREENNGVKHYIDNLHPKLRKDEQLRIYKKPYK